MRLATKAYHVFKYADRPVLQFQCQVTLCLKFDGGCLGITPPKCQETKPHHSQIGEAHHGSKRSRLALKRRIRSQRFETRDQLFTSLDIFTKPIMIVDKQFANFDNCKISKTTLNNTYTQRSEKVELWKKKMTILMPVFAGITILNFLISGAAVIFCVVNRRIMHKVTFND